MFSVLWLETDLARYLVSCIFHFPHNCTSSFPLLLASLACHTVLSMRPPTVWLLHFSDHLPMSKAFSISFLLSLSPLSPLIKLITQKLWVIKPHLWPQIKFFSSRGQESWRLCVIQQQPFTGSMGLTSDWGTKFPHARRKKKCSFLFSRTGVEPGILNL